MCARSCKQRKGAERAEEILTANKKAVSNEGTVKIAARKTKDTTLVRRGLAPIHTYILGYAQQRSVLFVASRLCTAARCAILCACAHVLIDNAPREQEMKPGSKIAWEFRLEKKDIGLSATFQRWENESQSEPTTETVPTPANTYCLAASVARALSLHISLPHSLSLSLSASTSVSVLHIFTGAGN